MQTRMADEDLLTFFDPPQERKSRKLRKSGKYQNQPKATLKNLTAKTPSQHQLIEQIKHKEQVFATGPAGTGKTYITSAMASQYLRGRKVDRIILTRPNVGTGRSIGFFPGTLEEKMDPWVAQMTHVFNEYLGEETVNIYRKNGGIEVVPFEVIRGRSFDNAFIILSEAQNTTIEEMKAFITRTGECSKTVIEGDVTQTDIKKANGLDWALRQVSTSNYLMDNVGLTQFTSDDIIRSELCKAWVQVMEKEAA